MELVSLGKALGYQRQPFLRHGDPHAPFDAHELLALGLDHRPPCRHDGRLAVFFFIAFSSRAKALRRLASSRVLAGRVDSLRASSPRHRQALFARQADLARRTLDEMPQPIQRLHALPGVDDPLPLLLGRGKIGEQRFVPGLDQLPIGLLARFRRGIIETRGT